MLKPEFPGLGGGGVERPAPTWSGQLRSGLVLLAAAALVVGTALHWGGVYEHVSLRLAPATMVLWLCVVWAAVEGLCRGQQVGGWVDVWVLAFLAYAAWACGRSPAEFPARIEWLWIGTYGGLVLALRHGLAERNGVPWMLVLVLLAGVASCAYAILWGRNQPLLPIWGEPRPDYGERVSGTFGCPNHFANFCVQTALVGMFLGAFMRWPWPVRIICFYFSVVLTAGVFFSVSRGGYLAWAAGMGVVAWYAFRAIGVRWWWKVLLLAVVLAMLVLAVARNDFVMGRVQHGVLDAGVRLWFMEAALRIWWQEPWFGAGPATFDYLFMRMPSATLETRALYTHCDYLNTLADYGAVGLFLVLGFLSALMASWYRNRHRPGRAMMLRKLAWASLAAMAVHEIPDFNLHIPACALLFLTVMGASTATLPWERRPARWWQPVAWLLIGAGILVPYWYGPVALRTWKGSYFFEEERKVLKGRETVELAAFGEELYRLDPQSYERLGKVADHLRRRAGLVQEEMQRLGRTPERLRAREEAGRLALLFYQRAYEANPLDDTLWVRRGMTLDLLDRGPEAYLHYARALELRPGSSAFRRAMAAHLVRAGNFQEAAALLKRPLQEPALKSRIMAE